MATYTFETITAAQAASFAATDNLIFTSSGASANNNSAYAYYGTGAMPVIVSFGGKSISFGSGLYGHSISFVDGTIIYVGSPYASDVITGSGGNDVLLGGGNENNPGGADSINGGVGNDTINLGGSGSANGGEGNDWIIGGQTADGGNGNDLITVGQNTRTVTGGAGDDSIVSWDYNPVSSVYVDAGSGNDEVRGVSSSGNDTFIGGSGIDTLNYSLAEIDLVVDLNITGLQAVTPLTGADLILGFENMIGGYGNDSLRGDGAANIIIGYQGDDTLSGEGGNDTINPGEGRAVVIGGAGIDTLSYDASGGSPFVARTKIDLLAGTIQAFDEFGNPWAAGTVSGIEVVVGSNGADSIVGSGADETLTGGPGFDLIEGGGGNDLLTGGGDRNYLPPAGEYERAGDTLSYEHASGGVVVNLGLTGAQNVGGGQGVDTITGFGRLWGGAFNDVLTGDGTANYIQGGSGNDTIDTGAGNDGLDGGAGNDILDGGAGNDTIYYAAATSGVSVRLGLTAAQDVGGGMGVDTLLNLESLVGSAFGDTITETTGVWSIDVGNGNDVITSLGGADTIYTGLGDDTVYRSASGGALLWNGPSVNTQNFSYDTVDYSSAAGSIAVSYHTANSVTDRVTGFSKIVGSAYSDQFSVASFVDIPFGPTIFAGAGNDTIVSIAMRSSYLRGEDGDDSILGGTAFDDINGNKGNDTAAGGAGADWVVGGQSNDLLYGGAAAVGDTTDNSTDIVYGNLGNDSCYGGAGDDTIRGGQGDDLVFGENGNDWLSGDRGNDTLTGGAGADIFHSFSGAGIDRVLDFNLAQGDRIQLDPGTTYTVSQVGSDTVINMGNGDQVILVGVSATSLTGSWIFIA